MGDIIILKKKKEIKKKNLKHLFIKMDEIIFKSLNFGNIHFFITINFEKNIKNFKDLKKKIKDFEDKIKEIELISWYNIVTELNKKNNYHIHCIIAIKSLIGYNDVIENNIRYYFINNYEIDSKVNSCWNFLDVKKAWRYLYKDEKKTNEKKEEILKTNLNIDPIFKAEKEKKTEDRINIIKIEKQIENWFTDLKKEIDTISTLTENNNFNNFSGIKIDQKNYNEKQIFIIWDYFLYINNMVIYKEKIYLKIEKYMISYKEFKNISFLYDNINEIFFFFRKNFPFQFENFDELNFILKFVKNKNEKIIRFEEFSGRKVNFNFNILEFRDGIYSVIHNKFIRTNKFNKNYETDLKTILKNKEIITIKWYNQSFENLNEPKLWLESIEKVMGLKNRTKGLLNKIAGFLKEDDIEWLLIYIAYVFHYSSNEMNKKSTLYIWGPSNTGKTTLIINLFINYFGKNNIGLISNNKNFEYQHIVNKNIIIFDEVNIEKMNLEDLKKLINKELILGEKKNKNSEIIEATPMIMSSNYKLEDKLIFNENKESIFNRLKIINFKEQFKVNEMDFDINNKLKEEEGKIIVYCNKVYFKWIKKGKKTRMDDIKMIEYF